MSKAIDIRSDLKTTVTRAVREVTGLHERLAVPIAEDIAKRLELDIGSGDLYLTQADRAQRNRAIREQFNGRNHDDVCSMFGISRRTLYRAISDE